MESLLAVTCVFSWVLGISLPTHQPSTSAPPSYTAAVDPGTIAYVRRSTHDIHLISPDGQQIVFERVADVNDSTSSLWIVKRDGSGLRKLADDAGRPAWGPTLPPPAHR